MFASMWEAYFLNDAVKAELDEQPIDVRAAVERIVQLIRDVGLEQVHEPYVKHLDGWLWEMRLKGKDGIARAIYATATGKRIVVVRVFTKKTQKTPQRELKLAQKRAKEVE